MSEFDYPEQHQIKLTASDDPVLEKNARAVAASRLSRYTSVIAKALRTMEDPDDVSRETGAAFIGVPGSSNFCLVDFCGNAFVIESNESKTARQRGQADLFPEVDLTFLPGWFLQTIIRARLPDYLGIPRTVKEDTGGLVSVYRGDLIDLPVEDFKKSVPFQITLEHKRPLTRDKKPVGDGLAPFHYHITPSRWSAILAHEESEDGNMPGPPKNIEKLEWSRPRLGLTVAPGVYTNARQIAASSLKQFRGAFETKNDLWKHPALAVFGSNGRSLQELNLNLVRIQSANLPRGFGRVAPDLGASSPEDWLPPYPFVRAVQAELERQQEQFLDDAENSDSELPIEIRNAIDPSEAALPTEEDSGESDTALNRLGFNLIDGSVPHDQIIRQYRRPFGECFSLFRWQAIMQRLQQERSAMDIFLTEEDMMFTALPRFLTWLGSEDNFDPLIDPYALVLELIPEDPNESDYRFEVYAVPLDGDKKPQEPPYDLSQLPPKPPFYRVIVQRTANVRLGYRTKKKMPTDLLKGGVNYVEIKDIDQEFDQFRTIKSEDFEDGFVEGGSVLTQTVSFKDFLNVTKNGAGVAADQMMMIAGFTPAGWVADLYDGANLLVYLATIDRDGIGYDMWGRPITPDQAFTMAIGVMPGVTSGGAKTAFSLASSVLGLKDIGMLGYGIMTGGSRTEAITIQHAEQLYETVTRVD